MPTAIRQRFEAAQPHKVVHRMSGEIAWTRTCNACSTQVYCRKEIS